MTPPGRRALAGDLRLIVITDATMASPRSLAEVVGAALTAGARTIQLRDKGASSSELLAQVRHLLNLTRPAGALLFVNDRVDVALAAGADGVHLGPEDLPVDAVRALVPSSFLIGYSADRPGVAREAAAAGADYIGCGAVFGTTTKDVGDEAIGVERLDRVARAVDVPVVGIGGVTLENVEEVAATAASGVAVVGAVMAAPDPAGAVEALLRPFRRRKAPA